MNSLKEYFDEIDDFVKTFKTKVPYFRGVNVGTFDLKPSLLRNNERLRNKKYKKTTSLENNLYYDFTSYGKGILDVENDWDILFKMQHYGFPTRLLDWTESLGIALYFALNYSQKVDEPCIWVLDPYALNELEKSRKKLFTNREYSTLYNPAKDFIDSYYNYFIVNHLESKSKLFETPQALYPIKSNQRVRAQWGVFTIHGTDERCLNEQVSNDILRKFPIKRKIINEAKEFLKHSSLNHFSMMPDFEGLQRYIHDYYYKN